jgi:hypothetical protein
MIQIKTNNLRSLDDVLVAQLMQHPKLQ